MAKKKRTVRTSAELKKDAREELVDELKGHLAGIALRLVRLRLAQWKLDDQLTFWEAKHDDLVSVITTLEGAQ